VGKGHVKLTVLQDNPLYKIKAIAWRWGDYFPLPPRVDIAYKLKENFWNGNTTIELELVGVRLPKISSLASPQPQAEFYYNQRHYSCSLNESLKELRIKNHQGKVLAIQQGQRTGLLGTTAADSAQVDVTEPRYFHLIKAALKALNLPEELHNLSKKSRPLNTKSAKGFAKERKVLITLCVPLRFP
jgi:single-stranded-DNA-specific exonuclease